MKNRIFFFVLILGVTLFAQRSELKKEAGYADFSNLSVFDKGDMVAEVILENHLLRMVAKMVKKDDPQLFELLNGLKLVKVNAFRVNESNREEIVDIMNKVDGKLTAKGWDRIVRVIDRSERANIYIKTGGEDSIMGLVVTAIGEDNEAAFVNIVGNINLETIGRLSEKFDIPELDKIGIEKNKNDNN